MNLAWHQVGEAIIHEPMPLHTGQAVKIRAHHAQPEMASTVASARMPRMLIAFVRDA